MFAQVLSAQYQPGKVDEGLAIWKELWAQAAAQGRAELDYLKGRLLLVDRASDRAYRINLYNSDADWKRVADATEVSPTWREAMEKMRSLLVPGSASEEVIDLAYWELKEGAPALAVVASGRYLLHRHDEMMSVWRDLAVLDRQTPEGRVGFLMYGIRATGRAVRINLWESPAAQTRTAQRLRDDGRWQALLARHERYAVPNVGVIERCEVAHGELRRAVGSGLPEA